MIEEVVWPGAAVHCSACGAPLQQRHIYGRRRGVCGDCGRIDFRNPTVGVAVVVQDGAGRLLMVKRGPNMTQAGLWSMPAGFMDYGEEVRAAGAREVQEETGLVVAVGDLMHVATTTHDPAKMGVCIWFQGAVTGGKLRAGDDAVEAAWFDIDDLPRLAFETDRAVISRLG